MRVTFAAGTAHQWEERVACPSCGAFDDVRLDFAANTVRCDCGWSVPFEQWRAEAIDRRRAASKPKRGRGRG